MLFSFTYNYLFNVKKETPLSLKILTIKAYEQALWGTLAEGVGGGERKESLQLCLWNLNICIEKVGAKCWFAEMTWVMMSLPLAHVSFQCLCTFVLVSALRWLAEIWQLSWRGVTGVLEVEFKFQRRSSGLEINARKLTNKIRVILIICEWEKYKLANICEKHC